MIKLYKHQAEELEATKDLKRVAYYHDMGLGKTFTGAEKMIQLGAKVNLVICQKSKVDDWVNHFEQNYGLKTSVMNLTDPVDFRIFINEAHERIMTFGVINYELAFRRPELLQLKDFTLMLDESSMIQNEKAKRTKFILRMKPENVILLSGTPTAGKYEKLYSQIKLLGWNISKNLYWNQYVKYHVDKRQGFPLVIVDGYKNVDRLKAKLREHGCRFMKSEEVLNLPEQIFSKVSIPVSKEYRKFKKDRVVTVQEKDLVGDTTLTKMLYERMLCGHYNPEKLKALEDLIESTEDRLIIFYNFNDELREIENICLRLDRPLSIVNGHEKDLSIYEEYDDSVTAIQYQAGSMGLNLQKANKIIYFTLPLSSELFEQSKKRIHRIGQNSTCFYYMLICKNSIEEKIYRTLEMRKDYTDKLFEEDE